jgi:hypothetical protein
MVDTDLTIAKLAAHGRVAVDEVQQRNAPCLLRWRALAPVANIRAGKKLIRAARRR